MTPQEITAFLDRSRRDVVGFGYCWPDQDVARAMGYQEYRTFHRPVLEAMEDLTERFARGALKHVKTTREVSGRGRPRNVVLLSAEAAQLAVHYSNRKTPEAEAVRAYFDKAAG